MLPAVVMAAMMAGTPTVAWPQQPPPPSQSQPQPQFQGQPPVPAAPPRGNPGLVEEIGKLFKGSSGLSLPSPREALDGLNTGTQDAADRLKQMAPAAQAMVSGRTLCPAAANGAPDCKAAADQLCKGNGFREGRGVDIESAQKCSAKAYFSGRGACQTENFVTRAVCQ
jgi:hypothetical protein